MNAPRPHLGPYNRFSRIDINNWRQFSRVAIEFHERLTVLTGANGAGKTTVLNLLGPHFSWKPKFLAEGELDQNFADRENRRNQTASESVRLSYTSGATSRLISTGRGTSPYQVEWQSQQTVPGLFIASHRSPPSPKQVSSIPTSFGDLNKLLNEYISQELLRINPENTTFLRGSNMPAYKLKESLIGAAVFSQTTSAVQADRSAVYLWEGIQSLLSRLLPSEIEFQRLYVKSSELFLETKSNSFPLDAMSGGISAIVEYAWMILLASQDSSQFTVCFDEPENHLHPSLQRHLMPALISAFPNVQFIVATHSPFIVNSSTESNVYALDFSPNGQVESRALDFVNKSQAAEETLRNVLGVSSTLPVWVERDMDRIMRDFSSLPPQADRARWLADQLRQAGLESEFSATVLALANRQQ